MCIHLECKQSAIDSLDENHLFLLRKRNVYLSIRTDVHLFIYIVGVYTTK